jgi:hypothetical protein
MVLYKMYCVVGCSGHPAVKMSICLSMSELSKGTHWFPFLLLSRVCYDKLHRPTFIAKVVANVVHFCYWHCQLCMLPLRRPLHNSYLSTHSSENNNYFSRTAIAEYNGHIPALCL